MIYLDNGATSFPKPEGMMEAMDLCMRTYCGNPGRSGHDMSMRTGEEVYQTRKTLADLFGIARPDRILFTSNTTEALNLGIKGVLRPGDHVITTKMEHNSVLRPIQALESEGVSHTFVDCTEEGKVRTQEIVRAIRQNTKLIVCTQASNVTGTIMPIQEISRIARENNILFLVDGAQGAGHLEMEAAGIDMLAVPGHKGLLGPLGTGMLYVREGVELKHLMQGGTGTASKELIQPVEFPEGFESGTLNAPGIIGLGYSAAFVQKIGVDVIHNYEMSLIKILEEAMRNMENIHIYGCKNIEEKVGIIAFNIEGRDCESVAAQLNDEYAIAVRGGYHCAGLAHKTIGTWEQGAVRVSVGPYNTKKEMEKFIHAIYRMTR